MNSIILNEIIVNKQRVEFKFSVTGHLQRYFQQDPQLFFEYHDDISAVPQSILAIPFVANLMPLVWITDATLWVQQLDEAFGACLGRVKSAYQAMYPHVKFQGCLWVDAFIFNDFTPQYEAAALFSGGLDALTTFIRVKSLKPLLITEYGWHGVEKQHSAVWEADKKNALQFACEHGLDNILIQSNYGTFIKAGHVDEDFRKRLGDTWWHGLHHGLAIITAVVPMAFKLKIACIYIASSNSPLRQVTCASDPSVDNEIRFASGIVRHDGYELTRQHKVKVVVDHFSTGGPGSRTIPIRVCFQNEANCCRCEKCLRTMMGIIAEGKRPDDYGFPIAGNQFNHIHTWLDNEVKFLSDTFIAIYWQLIQKRMAENRLRIEDKELLEWFLHYDFKQQRKRMLLKYRVKHFFPIVRRKISDQLQRLFAS